MPPFASAELSRDSPLDELAMRHSITSVSSSTRPNSISILDAFPLPPDATARGSPPLGRTGSLGSMGPDSSGVDASVDAHSGEDEESDDSFGRTGGLRPSTPQNNAPGHEGVARSGRSSAHGFGGGLEGGAADWNAEDRHGGHTSGELVTSLHSGGSTSAADRDAGLDLPLKPPVRGHSRMASNDTIRRAPDLPQSPVSRTQERYQRYGHSYSGSQGLASPDVSPKRVAPPPLGPTWRSLGLAPNSAPNSAVSPVGPPGPLPVSHPSLPPPATPSGTTGFTHHHTRVPSQPGHWYAQTAGSPTKTSAPSSAVSSSYMFPPPSAPLHLHSPSRSWDSSSTTRLRIPALNSAAEHMREGSASLGVDSRLTLEHWAAAATRFGSAAANLLLELGWAEHWIPWSIITGLVLPPDLAAVDTAELKYGSTPCIGRIADALHGYGVRLQVRQQDAAAMRAFNLAEALGSVEAVFSAAHLCMKGGRQVKKDVTKARMLLRRVNDI